ncbi:MAG: small multi-drug export protein [Spirochaetaceae bacterium]|jgi:uncharacterized membrane protein|nr:small multi-drug export protein [Spirochaetaceae bacterium]
MRDIIIMAFLSILPISELRGAIPFAVGQDFPWYMAWPVCSGINAAAAPLCWLFLSTFHKLFLRMAWYHAFFDRFIERARAKLRPGVEKWGAAGIAFFVAIPLPITGAWTGTLGAWVLGIPKAKTMLAVILGVIISGGIVSAVTVLGIQALRLFTR